MKHDAPFGLIGSATRRYLQSRTAARLFVVCQFSLDGLEIARTQTDRCKLLG